MGVEAREVSGRLQVYSNHKAPDYLSSSPVVRKGSFLSKLVKIQCWKYLLVILGFLLSACSAVATQSPTETPTPNPLELGRAVFLETCAQCHGESGEGYANELAAPALNESEHAWHHPDQQICDWILNGKLGVGREMPSQGEQLSPQEVSSVIAYLHTLWAPEQLADQQDVTSRWPETPSPDCGF